MHKENTLRKAESLCIMLNERKKASTLLVFAPHISFRELCKLNFSEHSEIILQVVYIGLKKDRQKFSEDNYSSSLVLF